MGLEQSIADLVTASNNLVTAFTTKAATIDASVAAAVRAIPAMKLSYWLRSDGNDTNDGTAASPLKTIDEVLARVPPGGYVSIWFLDATTYTLNSNQYLRNASVEFFVDAAVTGRPKITFGISTGASSTILPYSIGIDNCFLKTTGIDIDTPSIPANNTATVSDYGCISFGKSSGQFLFEGGTLTLGDWALCRIRSGDDTFNMSILSATIQRKVSTATTKLVWGGGTLRLSGQSVTLGASCTWASSAAPTTDLIGGVIWNGTTQAKNVLTNLF